MTAAKWLVVTGAAMISVLSLTGCPKKAAETSTSPGGVQNQVQGTGDTSKMPPEARAKMEADMKKAQRGAPARR